MKTPIKLILIAFLICTKAFAQDKIYKKNGDVISVKVLEVGESEIKYKLLNDSNEPIYSIDKDRLKKTVYENGREELYKTSLKDASLYEDQARNALKFNFLAPLMGYTQLSFERSLKPGRSYELTLGIIGLGKRQKLYRYYNYDMNGNYYTTTKYREAAGVFLGAGYKFLTLPNFIRNGDKYSHILQGWYAKPEIMLGAYSQNNFKNQLEEKETVTMGSFIINIGKQWVLGELFLIDLYAGLGYALDNQGYEYNNYNGNHFALNIDPNSGLGATGGFKIGLLLNNKKLK